MNVGKSICPMQFEKFEFPRNNGTSRAWHSTIFCAFSKKCYLIGLSLSCDSKISTSGKFPLVMRICALGNWLFEGRLNSVLQQRFGDFWFSLYFWSIAYYPWSSLRTVISVSWLVYIRLPKMKTSGQKSSTPVRERFAHNVEKGLRKRALRAER